MKLTPQQQAVVNHNQGPALVFAVAGAGKTTAMVQRIERLVREGVFPAERILATSFGRLNKQDLEQALGAWPHCRRVDVRTLHSLGRQVIVTAQKQGHLARLRLDRSPGERQVNQRLLNAAVSLARRRNAPFKRELEGLDRADFLDYVSRCKGNLLYADLDALAVTGRARELAGQAEPPSLLLDWYLDLYRLYEQARREQGLVTFDDMLLTGWEALARFPDVLEAVQSQYQAVLVDEFQDINLAQSEILDLVSRPHRNYMAIGDDDQTIYEWRGARTTFILDFARRYQAQTYLISENFRCQLRPLLLANQIITHNKQREKKQLALTRGLAGRLTVERISGLAAMAGRLVQQIQAYREEGLALNEMAVLVRIHAQTPAVEVALLDQEIPYRSEQPFFERPEIKTLIDYGRLAWYEQRFQNGPADPLSGDGLKTVVGAWQRICNRPKRYISQEVRRQAALDLRRGQKPLSDILTSLTERLEADYLVENLALLAGDLRWLAGQLQADARTTLKQLEARLDYKQFLLDSSGFIETGRGRAAGVDVFIDYAGGHASLAAYLQHIRALARQQARQAARRNAVTLSTIHKAKGLEWPVVLIPQCNEEIIPFGGQQAENMEEERRLLYVAVTRSRRHLHIYYLKKGKISPFLAQARWKKTLTEAEELAGRFSRSAEGWSAADILGLSRTISDYGLRSYFETWWDAAPADQAAAAGRIMAFLALVKERGLLEELRLKEADLGWWAALAADGQEEGTASFPDLDRLIQPAPRQKGQAGKPQEKEGKMLRPGVWLYCDAGWGRIEKILDSGGRPLAALPVESLNARLQVTLRPDLDAEPIEFDLAAARIRFTRARKVYACTKCGSFMAADFNLIIDSHNNQAHGGTGAGFRPAQRDEKLTHFRFSWQEPE